MILCKVSTLMGERRLSIRVLSAGAGVAYTTIQHLYHDQTTRISFDVLDRLCKYFGLQPGDLLEYVDDAEFEQDDDRWSHARYTEQLYEEGAIE